jgi:flagellar biosynthesis/type III secretory pathway protein FliH
MLFCTSTTAKHSGIASVPPLRSNHNKSANGKSTILFLGRKAGRQEGRKAGRQEGRKAGRQEGRKAGRQEGRKAGRQEVYRLGKRTGE